MVKKIYIELKINKTTQLLLHAGLGAGTNALKGNDALSGAVSGVSGELFGELFDKNNNFSDNDLIEIGGFAGALSSIVVGKIKGLDANEISDNAWSGYRTGKNAVENNYLMPQEKGDLVKELKNCAGNSSCENRVQEKYEAISEPRDEEFKLAYEDCKNNNNCNKLKEIHYDLRMELTEEGNEYFNSLSEEEREKEFELLPNSKSVYHTFLFDSETGLPLDKGQNNNKKYVHPIYGYEVVVDSDNNIVTDHVNMGTYNFYNPKSNINKLLGGFFIHKELDVDSYKILGNSLQDNTVKDQRGFKRILNAYQ